MENNFIQMAAPTGHTRSVQFLNTLSTVFSCILHISSRILSFKATKFCEQKFVQRGPITIAIDCNGFIFEEKWPNYASGRKFEPNSDSFWVRKLFNVCVPTRSLQFLSTFSTVYSCTLQISSRILSFKASIVSGLSL